MVNKFFVFACALLLSSCGTNSGDDYDKSLPTVKTNNVPPPAPLIFSVKNMYPHDPTAFTQGLEFYNGKLYEGTGEYGESRLRILDVKTGKAEKDHLLTDKSIFGEGITIFKDKLYQLTWKNNKIFVYGLTDITKPLNTYSWPKEGWGATNDGEYIIISDGTSKLYFVQPDEEKKEMKLIKVLNIINNEGEVDSLNELEYIEGYIYANIWFRNEIVKIDPNNGYVVGVMNLTGLLKQYAPEAKFDPNAVLNGIAYDSISKNLYITGKLWPKLFEMHLN